MASPRRRDAQPQLSSMKISRDRGWVGNLWPCNSFINAHVFFEVTKTLPLHHLRQLTLHVSFGKQSFLAPLSAIHAREEKRQHAIWFRALCGHPFQHKSRMKIRRLIFLGCSAKIKEKLKDMLPGLGMEKVDSSLPLKRGKAEDRKKEKGDLAI